MRTESCIPCHIANLTSHFLTRGINDQAEAAHRVIVAIGLRSRESQGSPHISNRSKYLSEQGLSLEHSGEGFHQRKQTAFRHGRDQVVQHASLIGGCEFSCFLNTLYYIG